MAFIYLKKSLHYYPADPKLSHNKPFTKTICCTAAVVSIEIMIKSYIFFSFFK